ncbi:EPIDERMAL PATTERNING FACTOR-like protein 3 [Capsicum baccatum]|uniref:Epidermal patterning factor-like protein n=1 Tax=Capsicum baccatum TaxID=33114 RepID=A0A2G2V8R0_CAPBA|nr:EPIDERMAL PATTERNING FACTOR-like protein 3 [Capsicum baccatum]
MKNSALNGTYQLSFYMCLLPRPLASNQHLVHSANELKGNTSNVSKEDMKMIGSSPPSCEHKCYGCMPCEAIQVPTNTGRVGVQYTNYEPEGWKCKCGPAFYTP